MKLTINKFKQRHIYIKEQKKDKIPDQCFDCYYLSLFKKDNIYYYACDFDIVGIPRNPD